MAGTIDANIIKPGLALDTFRSGQEAQANQIKLDQLQYDRMMLNQLQTKLRAAGKNDDPIQFFRALTESGNPEYMVKGYDGLQRVKALQEAEAIWARDFGGAKPGAPTANALAAPAQPSVAAPTNAMAAGAPAAPAAPANALVAPQDRAQDLRRKIAEYEFSGHPKLKALAEVYKAELGELTKPQVIGAGATLYQGGKPVYTAPEAAPALLKEYNAAKAEGYKGTLADFKTLSANRTTVNLTQERAEKGARGKLLVDQYDAVSKQAGVASKTLPSIDANLSILDKGFDTGFGTETKAAGAKVLAALGIPEADKYATNAQTFLANASQAVLTKQLEQKGPQTESDAQRITQTGAQLGNTKDANKFVLSVAKAQAKRDVEQRNFYDRWWKTNGTYDGAEDAWYQGEGGQSLFNRPELKSYSVKPTGNPSAPNGGQIPQAAIDALKSGKGTDAQFDAIFGAGAAKRVKGQ